MLQLIAIPLVFISLVKGITGLNDIKKFSRLGGKTILIYIGTTFVAVVLGLLLGLVVQPGKLVNREQVAHMQESYKNIVEEKKQAAEMTHDQGPLAFLYDIIPNNIVSATADNSKMLQVIFFAIFFGIAALTIAPDKYPVQLFAFSTSSSAATLPLTLETVERELKVSEEVSSFVLPVGTTINMDGTSCYQSIAILFIAQVLGIDLSISQLLIIVAMTILSSIGTPAIPGGSYVILTMVLTSVGIPAEGLALILGIDRPLDMLRTAVNVTGDATVASMVDK